MVEIDPFAGISNLFGFISLMKGSFLACRVGSAPRKLIPDFDHLVLHLETNGNQWDAAELLGKLPAVPYGHCCAALCKRGVRVPEGSRDSAGTPQAAEGREKHREWAEQGGIFSFPAPRSATLTLHSCCQNSRSICKGRLDQNS